MHCNNSYWDLSIIDDWKHHRDAISSLAIGTILMVFAAFLANENKGLLICEGISRREYRRIFDVVLQIPEVNRIVSLRTMHFALEDVLVAMEVNLEDGSDTHIIEIIIDVIEQQVRQVLSYIIRQRSTSSWNKIVVGLTILKRRSSR